MAVFTIQVTEDDIDSGKPGDGCLCPIALAVLRVLPKPREGHGLWSIGMGDLFLSSAPVTPMPAAAQDFIGAFDSDHLVEPFSFTLDVPDGLLAQVTG